jgi:hypothetical protein
MQFYAIEIARYVGLVAKHASLEPWIGTDLRCIGTAPG